MVLEPLHPPSSLPAYCVSLVFFFHLHLLSFLSSLGHAFLTQRCHDFRTMASIYMSHLYTNLRIYMYIHVLYIYIVHWLYSGRRYIGSQKPFENAPRDLSSRLSIYIHILVSLSCPLYFIFYLYSLLLLHIPCVLAPENKIPRKIPA